MRLLHAKDLKLHSFSGSDIPPYAILSHRWGESEVVFQDLQSGNSIEIARANLKVAGCCAKAMEDGYEYVVSSGGLLLRIKAEVGFQRA